MVEALDSYRLHCGAQAARLRPLADDRWKVWALKGAELTEIIAGLKKGWLWIVEQQRLEI
jgi:hypothetical protein